MAEIIASTYEILKKIGEGGGGIVYLANHMRLQKLVVMKADKRGLQADQESLEREVKLLKNLSHTYIPQVYDYFEENGIVYTVIDYIEGESLDKPLNRGVKFAQPKIVKWACEALEALVYLHGQTPGILHADIKPSNIMVTPEGDIRLIDFNISLLLKESGAVRVGYSWGYASPEHYSADFRDYNIRSNTRRSTFRNRDNEASLTAKTERISPKTDTETFTIKTEVSQKTECLIGRKTETTALLFTDSGGSGGNNERPDESSDLHKPHTILLDARSDIYSMGATLYHLACGMRPANDAREVIPLEAGEISAELCRIINKAMSPNPDQRYQTALEMLYDLEHLHENDPRTKRLRRVRRIAFSAFALLFLAGGSLSLLGLQQEKNMERAVVLAGESREALRHGDPVSAAELASSALPEELSLLNPVYVPEAQAALASALGVYDLADGFRETQTVNLSSEALKVLLSPAGTRLCALCAWELSVFDTESGEKLVTLPIEESALSSAVFLDENRIAYSAPGALAVYDISTQKEFWRGEPATSITVSADMKRITGIYKDDTVVSVYDAENGELMKTVTLKTGQRVAFNDTFADPKDNLLSLNQDGSYLAVSDANGGLHIYDLLLDMEIEVFEVSDYRHFEGGFFGHYFAFSGIGGGKSVFMLIDLDAQRSIGSIEGTTRFGLQVDESGIYLSRDNLLVRFDPETLTDRELAFTEKSIVSFRCSGDFAIISTEDKRFSFFDRGAGELAIDRTLADFSCDHVDLAGVFAIVGSVDSPTLRLLRLENHPETEVFQYDSAYLHNEARLSADGTKVMLFRFDAFRIYDVGGEIVCDVSLPNAEQVYDQQFRREDGKSYLEVIWYDGTVRKYSAEDGSLLAEEQREPPDESLFEEFFTSRFRITSPLHGTPTVYERDSGKLVCELEKDAYLTYVTESGECLITEYITAQGERYGLLLDQNLQTIAELPNLCDVLDGRLLFDYSSGNIRETRIFTLQELKTMQPPK